MPWYDDYDDNNYIFVEDLFFNDNKGRISVIKIDGDNYEFQGEVIEEDFHLSFPFLSHILLEIHYDLKTIHH